MRAKLRLNQKEKYALLIAANEIAQMLVAFIQGHEHSLSIGAEQGEIKHWDDFVVEEADRTYKHIQVKRQQTDFSDAPCVRDTYSKGKRKGQLRDLSPIDEPIKSLADWINKDDPKTSFLKRRFVVEVPDNSILIKNEIKVRHFHTLCHSHICTATSAKDLEALARTDKDVKSCFDWLTTWCGFSDWDHILKALRFLEIKQSGNDNDINERTETTLSHVFCQPNEVRRRIISYIDENSTYAGAITP